MTISKSEELELTSLTLALLPIMAAVFIAFLVIGLALTVLPLHVHDDLGLGGFVVGLVAGGQYPARVEVVENLDSGLVAVPHATGEKLEGP